jgi:DNA primase
MGIQIRQRGIGLPQKTRPYRSHHTKLPTRLCSGRLSLFGKFLGKKYPKADIEQTGLIIKKDRGQGSGARGPEEYFDRFRGRIMFPILNIHGQVVGFTGRLLHEKENAGKYINSPETPIYNKSRELYGLFAAKNIIRKENRCILMEGNMDVVSSHQAGYAQAVASSGTALTRNSL